MTDVNEWRDQLGLPTELANETNSPNGHSNGSPESPWGRAVTQAPKGPVFTDPATSRFDVGEIPLGRDGNGEVIFPSGIGRVPVVKVAHVEPPPPREYILDGLIPQGAASSLFGDGGVAKSLLAMSLCVAVSGGRSMWMEHVVEPCACLYMDFELSVDEQVRRTKGLCRGAGYEDAPDELYYMSALGNSSEAAFWSAYKAVDDYGIGLVVIDSFGLALQGESENASDVIGFYRKRLEPFVRDGVAILMVDHQAKGLDNYQRRTSFGSVYKRNLVRSEIQIEAFEQDEDSGHLDLVFRHTKHNFGPRLRPFGARVGFHMDEIQVGPTELEPSRMAMEEGFKSADRVIMALEDIDAPATPADIVERTGMALGTVKNTIGTLKRKGKVRSTGTFRGRVEEVELVPNPTVPQPKKEWSF